MKLRERYSRLTLWNKIGLWSGLASIVGLVISVWQISSPDRFSEIAKALDNVTGGGWFAYVIPQPHDVDGRVPLAIRSVGPNPLSGVRVAIHDISLDTPLVQPASSVDVGAMPRDTIRPLEGVYLQASTVPGTRIYSIDVSALNGMFEEVVRLRTSSSARGNCLADSITVTRRPSISETGSRRLDVLLDQGWHEYFRCGAQK